MPTIRDVAAFLEAWAPPGSAQSYDNVGLQVGDATRDVSRALIALDLTPAILDEASALEVELIITHHPLIFRPLKRITADDSMAGLAYRLAEAGLALYSIHTNLDAAAEGVSFALGRKLGLEGLRFLDHLPDSLQKLAIFVPTDHLETVRESIAATGAGRIGEYDSCAFANPGTGFFRPRAGASPFTGTAGGGLERVEEVRLEVEVPRWKMDDVLAAVRESHPYEEVAYDVYDVRQPYSRTGLGAIGTLPDRTTLGDFLGIVSEKLRVPSVRYAGEERMSVERVAVCGGSGSDLINLARRAGADAYVTADVTYHKFFDVFDASGRCRMALIDPGHYETEKMTEELLRDYLIEQLPEVEWHVTRKSTNPVRYFMRRTSASPDSSHEIKTAAS